MMAIHKNDNVESLKNYRPISLHFADYKTLTQAIADRIIALLGFHQSKEQAGFLKEYCAAHNFYSMNQAKHTNVQNIISLCM